MRFRTLLVAGWWAFSAIFSGLFSCANHAAGGSAVAEKLAIGAAIGYTAAPLQEAAIWVVDAKGQSFSYWLRGKANDIGVVAAARGLVIPVGDALWDWQVQEEPFALCDCDAWLALEREGECPEAIEMGVRLQADLVDRISKDRVSVPLGPGIAYSEAERLSEFRSEFDLLGSVGPFLFVRYREDALVCGAAHRTQAVAFVVFDMENRQEVDILSDMERSEVEKNEQQVAFELAREDSLVALGRPEDMELQEIAPWFDPLYGLRLSYLFAARSDFADPDGEPYASYTRQILVPARSIPEALRPFSFVPPMVPGFLIEAPGVRLGGWVPIACAQNQCPALQQAFRGPGPD